MRMRYANSRSLFILSISAFSLYFCLYSRSKNSSILNINAQIVSIQWQEDEVSIIQATFLILARHLFQKGF
jgi:hypothetical protein